MVSQSVKIFQISMIFMIKTKHQLLHSGLPDACCIKYYFSPGVFLIMSLVVTPPTDVLLLLLGPEDVMEVERVSQDKVRHFVKNKIRWLALRTSQLAGEESWDTCSGQRED